MIKRALVAVAMVVLVGWKSPIARIDDSSDIRAARLEQNRLLAQRDISGAARYWARDITVRAGLGTSLQGQVAYTAAFAADSSITYDRIPSEITVSTQWPMAFEAGNWTGRRTGDRTGSPLIGGKYSAQWEKVGGQWLIRSEVFVALECTGIACRWPASTP